MKVRCFIWMAVIGYVWMACFYHEFELVILVLGCVRSYLIEEFAHGVYDDNLVKIERRHQKLLVRLEFAKLA